ncbi:MAG TPA: hypothetical protein VLK84_10295 [Longimicrobium sp.]|nr:hypothetical protein [Longimicrobium sp.]
MKKTTLDVDTLAVESFEVGGGELLARGTVQANEGMLSVSTRDTSCDRTRCCPRTDLC